MTMSKQKERIRSMPKRKQQKSQTRWLVVAGVALILIAGLWFLFSNRQSDILEAQPISKLSTADFHSLAFSLTEPETVFFGHHSGLLVSHDGGRNWEPTALKGADAMALALPPSDPEIMYAAGHDVFFKSTDGGKTWESVSTNLPGTDIHGFTVDPENANHVYAHVVGFGIFGSEDGGSTWTQLSDAVPNTTFNLEVGADSQTLYATAGEAGLLRSTDGGQTWNKMSEAPGTVAIAVTYVRANNRIYVTFLGSAVGLYVSEDGGQTWSSANLNGTLLAVAVSPLDPDHILAVSDEGEVFASRNGGLTWSAK